ncbi:hypothetical protein R6Q59_003783, partial [Mikania micrantha]
NMPPRRHNEDDSNSGDANNGNANSGIQELATLITGLVNQLTQANQNINQNRGGSKKSHERVVIGGGGGLRLKVVAAN